MITFTLQVKQLAPMRLLLLAATGRTGKHILTYALEKTDKVNCLVRDKSKLPAHTNILAIEGNLTAEEDLITVHGGLSMYIANQ